MKKLVLLTILLATFTADFASHRAASVILKRDFTEQVAEAKEIVVDKKEENTGIPSQKFENAVALLKKYETMHTVRHWPYIGYGHLVQKNEKFTRRNYTEAEADKILRDDLRKFCDLFKDYGKDQLLLGVLAYSVGPYRLLGADGKIAKSVLLKKLSQGNRNIRNEYLSYCKYKGRTHKGLQQRRMEEFETLYLD